MKSTDIGLGSFPRYCSGLTKNLISKRVGLISARVPGSTRALQVGTCYSLIRYIYIYIYICIVYICIVYIYIIYVCIIYVCICIDTWRISPSFSVIYNNYTSNLSAFETEIIPQNNSQPSGHLFSVLPMVVGAAGCYFQVHLLHAYDNAPVATRAARAHAALEAKIAKPPAVMVV